MTRQQPEGKETILFVDDEESILDIARTYFEGRGYRVLTAANGKQALDFLGTERIDCCFTDINMPAMDGIELAARLHQYDNTLPVVVMTGFPSLEATIETLKNGVVDFLIKPVNLNQMELCLRRVMRERRLFIQNLLLSKEVEGKQKLEKLNRELMARIEELNILNRIMSDFTTVRESTGVFQHLVDLACEIAGAERTRFLVYNDELARAVAIAESQRRGQQGPQGDGRQGGGGGQPSIDPLVRRALGTGKALVVNADEKPGLLPGTINAYLLVPMKIRGKIFGVLEAVAGDADKRFSPADANYLGFMANKAAYAIENLALYENIFDNLLATLYAFVKAIEARDPYTQQHSNRVTRIAVVLAQAMGCSQEDKEILEVAGRLHDIGKIGIRDAILLKPGRLTDEEYRVIKQHPVIGAEIVDRLGLWNREKQIIRAHHERFDGKGYPDGLGRDEIPLLARILSVADVFDAIASDRAYRKKMPEERILQIMYGGAGTQFDPEVIAAFKDLYDRGVIQQTAQEPDAGNAASPRSGENESQSKDLDSVPVDS